MKYLYILLCLFLVISCGYRPTSEDKFPDLVKFPKHTNDTVVIEPLPEIFSPVLKLKNSYFSTGNGAVAFHDLKGNLIKEVKTDLDLKEPLRSWNNELGDFYIIDESDSIITKKSFNGEKLIHISQEYLGEFVKKVEKVSFFNGAERKKLPLKYLSLKYSWDDSKEMAKKHLSKKNDTISDSDDLARSIYYNQITKEVCDSIMKDVEYTYSIGFSTYVIKKPNEEFYIWRRDIKKFNILNDALEKNKIGNAKSSFTIKSDNAIVDDVVLENHSGSIRGGRIVLLHYSQSGLQNITLKFTNKETRFKIARLNSFRVIRDTNDTIIFMSSNWQNNKCKYYRAYVKPEFSTFKFTKKDIKLKEENLLSRGMNFIISLF